MSFFVYLIRGINGPSAGPFAFLLVAFGGVVNTISKGKHHER